MRISELTSEMVKNNAYYLVCEVYAHTYYDDDEFIRPSREIEVYFEDSLPSEVVSNEGSGCVRFGGDGRYQPEAEYNGELWEAGDLDVYDGYQNCTIQALVIESIEQFEDHAIIEIRRLGGGFISERIEGCGYETQ